MKIDALAYHKNCWEISGTKEWKQALASAKIIACIILIKFYINFVLKFNMIEYFNE